VVISGNSVEFQGDGIVDLSVWVCVSRTSEELPELELRENQPLLPAPLISVKFSGILML
jgi:hypothetical protein